MKKADKIKIVLLRVLQYTIKVITLPIAVIVCVFVCMDDLILRLSENLTKRVWRIKDNQKTKEEKK